MRRPSGLDVLHLPAAAGAALIATVLAASWGIEWELGGAGHFPPHWFYFAILLAGARFGTVGALTVAVASTVVAGPLLPDDVALSTAQAQSDWLGRGLFFCGIGLLSTWLFGRFVRAFDAERGELHRQRDTALEAMAGKRQADEDAAERERALQAETARQDFEARLRRGFEMAQDEPSALSVLGRALRATIPERPAKLLLADASEAHLRPVLEELGTGAEPSTCRVETPFGCPALRTGRTQVFSSSDDFDACPFLLAADGGAPTSAVCAPLTFMGRALGVLHTSGTVQVPLERGARQRLDAVVAQCGARLGMLRAFARSEAQASTDALTGLINRRVFDDRAAQWHAEGTSYALLIADLDHFKLVNDTFGHDAGDRALRLFARVLQACSQVGDLVCRYGGEEFTVLLRDSTGDGAVALAERIRTALATSLAGSSVAPFTASFGAASGRGFPSFKAALRAADSALFAAKAAGRDRVHRAEADLTDAGVR